MSYETNYSSLCCPYCKTSIWEQKELFIDIEDNEEEFYQCEKCEKFFKVELIIYKEYNYTASKPTEEEIKEYGLTVNKEDETEDVPGQTFMWEGIEKTN
jgi:hypothetical protein